MGAWRKILVPTDFSESAARALATGVALARRGDAELHFLRVVCPLTFDPYTWGYRLPDHQAVREALESEAREAMAECLAQHDIEGIRLRQSVMGADRPGIAIVEYADVNGIDLVVMGTHGRRGLGHLLIGSTAEETVRRASCEVLVVRAASAEVEPYEAAAPAAAGAAAPSALPWGQVLLPLDFSEVSLGALGHARDLAAEHEATLHLLHVVPPIPRPLLSDSAADTAEALERDSVQEAATRLAGLAKEGVELGVRTVADVQRGQPARAIVEYAAKEAIDLVVMPTHGLTGLQRFLLGSIAEKVVRHSPCPVLAWKARG